MKIIGVTIVLVLVIILIFGMLYIAEKLENAGKETQEEKNLTALEAVREAL